MGHKFPGLFNLHKFPYLLNSFCTERFKDGTGRATHLLINSSFELELSRVDLDYLPPHSTALIHAYITPPKEEQDFMQAINERYNQDYITGKMTTGIQHEEKTLSIETPHGKLEYVMKLFIKKTQGKEQRTRQDRLNDIDRNGAITEAEKAVLKYMIRRDGKSWFSLNPDLREGLRTKGFCYELLMSYIWGNTPEKCSSKDKSIFIVESRFQRTFTGFSPKKDIKDKRDPLDSDFILPEYKTTPHSYTLPNFKFDHVVQATPVPPQTPQAWAAPTPPTEPAPTMYGGATSSRDPHGSASASALRGPARATNSVPEGIDL